MDVCITSSLVRCAIGCLKWQCLHSACRDLQTFTDRGLPDTRIWLDATDSATEGIFIWMATQEVMTYTNWDINEPNNGGYYGGGEDCAHLNSRHGKWNDKECGASGKSVCESEYQE